MPINHSSRTHVDGSESDVIEITTREDSRLTFYIWSRDNTVSVTSSSPAEAQALVVGSDDWIEFMRVLAEVYNKRRA